MEITFVTCTYNRSHTLQRLFNSILVQVENFKIQWLIIDDGSTDNTRSLVENFIKLSNCNFSIDYIYKPNSGKQNTINYSYKFIKYYWTCIIDSDDWLHPDFIKSLKTDIEVHNVKNKNNISTIIYNSIDINGLVIGTRFPFDSYVSKPYVYYNKHNIRGDKFDIFKSSVLKKFQFPVYAGESFISEGVVWNRIHKEYDALFINKGLQIVEYQNEGYTVDTKKNRIANPNGAMLVNYEGFLLPVPFKRKIRYLINFFRFKFHSNKKYNDTDLKLILPKNKYLVIYPFFYFLAFIIFLNEK